MTNIHATAVVLGAKGVLILGASGSGKTTLALELIRRMRDGGGFGALVGDDQVIVEATENALVATAPVAIAGLAEIYGLGPAGVGHLGSSVIDLVCTLASDTPRYQEPGLIEIEAILDRASSISGNPFSPSPSRTAGPRNPGRLLPEIALPQRNIAQSTSVVFTHLRAGSFAGMRQYG